MQELSTSGLVVNPPGLTTNFYTACSAQKNVSLIRPSALIHQRPISDLQHSLWKMPIWISICYASAYSQFLPNVFLSFVPELSLVSKFPTFSWFQACLEKKANNIGHEPMAFNIYIVFHPIKFPSFLSRSVRNVPRE